MIDCALTRGSFAERIKKAVVARLALATTHHKTKRRRLRLVSSNEGRSKIAPLPNITDWKVSVDYFNGELPPAHFFVWTAPNKIMKEVTIIFLLCCAKYR